MYLVFIILIFNFADFFRGIVNHPDQYQIAFTGLHPGTHLIDFQIDDTFFEQVEDTEITGGRVSLHVTMAKEERMMDFRLEFDGWVTVHCDRCNELMYEVVNGTERLIVKLGDHYYEESEDVQIIPDTAHQFDLRPFIYEYIHLILPVRRVHPEDESGNSKCDPEILKKLNELSENHIPDPRWEVLTQLKKKK